MSKDDDDISADEQKAFSDAHKLIDALLKQGLDPADVGKGIFVAAIYALRKTLSNTSIAEIFYEAADDYATRDLIE